MKWKRSPAKNTFYAIINKKPYSPFTDYYVLQLWQTICHEDPNKRVWWNGELTLHDWLGVRLKTCYLIDEPNPSVKDVKDQLERHLNDLHRSRT